MSAPRKIRRNAPVRVVRLEDFHADNAGTVVALGYFDGVHVGHRRILERTIRIAQEQGSQSVLFTFEDHPAMVLRPENPPLLLTTLEEKALLLRMGQGGPDALVWCAFTDVFSHISARAFAQEVLVGGLRLSKAVVGPNYHFGHRAEGTPESLGGLGAEFGFAVEVVKPATRACHMISSTRVRELVTKGALKEAQRMLGHEYIVCGTVVHGEGRGSGLGFPTANVEVSPRKLVPADGVYATWLCLGDACYLSVTNLGLRPTFGDSRGQAKRTLETHVLDRKEDLYGKQVFVSFVERLRGERKFATPEALAAQIAEDIARARMALVHEPVFPVG